MAATIHDVAELAGVSISTVSRVLNKSARVNDDKRKRVEKAAEQLGYQPNPLARGLLKKKTGGIGVLLPFVSGEFFSNFLRGIDLRTQEEGLFLMISTSHRKTAGMQKGIRSFQQRVDGLILMATEFEQAHIRSLVDADMPIVLVNSEVQDLELDVINFDNYDGGYKATEHLIKSGHQRIATLKGPDRAYDARERLRGYRDALRAHGMATKQEWEIQADFSYEGGWHAAEQFSQLNPLPTAVFGGNDDSALAFMAAMQSKGFDIPKDIAIVGFDDISSTQYNSPPLSSIHVPVREMGMAALDLLLARIRGKNTERVQTLLPVHLNARGSSSTE